MVFRKESDEQSTPLYASAESTDFIKSLTWRTCILASLTV